MDVSKFVENVFNLLKYQDLWIPLGVVLLTTGYLGFWFGRFFPRHPKPAGLDGDQPNSPAAVANAKPETELNECKTKLAEALEREIKYSALHAAIFAEEGELWRLYDPKPYTRYSTPINVSRPKIIVIANNKGGVGKTTLSANLAAYFELRRNKRVLLIDLDYQGSLSAWMVKASGIHIPVNQGHRLAQANRLIDGDACNKW